MFSKKTNAKSFSLIELMIVITIIALLASAGVPIYIKYLQRAAVTEAVSVTASYKLSIGLFWSTNQRLPQAGDVLYSTPANLPFGTTVTNTATSPLPETVQSLLLSSSGNGILLTIVVQGNVFSTVAVNNRTLVLGVLPFGNELSFQCGNFTQNAASITDIGFTDITILPNGCDYNGVSNWLNT